MSRILPYIILDEFEQGSEEWHLLKSSSIGGTASYDLLRHGYEHALKKVQNAYESNKKYSGPVSKAAKWGNDHEPEARELLWKKLTLENLTKGLEIREVGALRPTNYEHVHYSPDGLIVDKSDRDKIKYLIEIKCYQMKHHLEVLKNQSPDDSVISQIQFGLWISKAYFCYYCGYCPLMLDETLTPDNKRHPEQVLFIKKIMPDKDYFKAFEEALKSCKVK